jgi:tRNA threonylcarbamoyladenosine biosynthesis protein TsaB
MAPAHSYQEFAFPGIRMSDLVTAASAASSPGAVAGFGSPAGLPAALSLAPIVNPTFLSLDSAGHACSAAVWRGGGVAARRLAEMTRGHGERLLPMVAETVAAAEIEMAALDAIAVTIGPGSFTGLRIGLAAARGLGLALARPVIGITSFLAVAAALPDELREGRDILVALDTKRDDFFLQSFDRALRAAGPARLVTASDLIATLPIRPLLLAGDGAPLLAPLLPAGRDILVPPGPGHADAGRFADLIARLLAHAGGAPEGALRRPEPFYLRDPDVKLPSAPVASRAAP